MKEIKKELKSYNAHLEEMSGNLNDISNKFMLQRLSDILGASKFNRKFVRAQDKETGLVILKPVKSGVSATYDGKNNKQKRKVARNNDMKQDLKTYNAREEAYVVSY